MNPPTAFLSNGSTKQQRTYCSMKSFYSSVENNRISFFESNHCATGYSLVWFFFTFHCSSQSWIGWMLCWNHSGITVFSSVFRESCANSPPNFFSWNAIIIEYHLLAHCLYILSSIKIETPHVPAPNHLQLQIYLRETALKPIFAVCWKFRYMTNTWIHEKSWFTHGLTYTMKGDGSPFVTDIAVAFIKSFQTTDWPSGKCIISSTPIFTYSSFNSPFRCIKKYLKTIINIKLAFIAE